MTDQELKSWQVQHHAGFVSGYQQVVPFAASVHLLAFNSSDELRQSQIRPKVPVIVLRIWQVANVHQELSD